MFICFKILAVVFLRTLTLTFSEEVNATLLDLLVQRRLAFSKLTSILRTEIVAEVADGEDIGENGFRSELVWENATRIEWMRAIHGIRNSMTPFILCRGDGDDGNGNGDYGLRNGRDRLIEMNKLFSLDNPAVETFVTENEGNEGSAAMALVQVVYNGEDMTCVLTRIPVVVAVDAVTMLPPLSASAGSRRGIGFIVQPLISLTKIVDGSVDFMERRYAQLDGSITDSINVVRRSGNENFREVNGNSNQNDNRNGKTDPDRRRGKRWLPPKLNILLCPGVTSVTSKNITNDSDEKEESMAMAEKQAQRVKNMLTGKSTENGTQTATKASDMLFGDMGLLGDAVSASSSDDDDEDEDDDDDDSLQIQSNGNKKGKNRKNRRKKKRGKKYWKKVFNNGVNANDRRCDRFLQRLEMKFDAVNAVLSLMLPGEENEISGEENADNDDKKEGEGEGRNNVQQQQQQQQQPLSKRQLRKFEKWCGLSLLAAVSLLDTVCMVETEPEMAVSNVQSSWLMQSGIENNFQFYDVGLDGTGQVVAVSDTGLDVDNCYFSDARGELSKDGTTNLDMRKVVQYIPYADETDYTYGHGTHVCGTVAGKKAPDGRNESDGIADGVARGAKIAFLDIGLEDSVSIPAPASRLLEETGGAAGAKLHSASWGSESNEYGFNARYFDEYIYRNDDFLIIVAAGNRGLGNAFKTVGDPATAKNVISVGASHSSGVDLASGMLGPAYVADFSSKGGASDGRTKPEVVAPGKFILSAGAQTETVGECDPGFYPSIGFASDGVVSKMGTSMATPAVSGIAAIVRQYFEEGWYPDGVKNDSEDNFRNPSGAAIKAVILNGAQPMNGVDNGQAGEVHPCALYDNITNFGRVSLIDSLYIPGKTNVDLSLWDREVVFVGDTTKAFNVTIDKSNGCEATEISFTLVWSDPPAMVGCRRCLLNDLDLYVKRSGDDTVYYPNGRTSADSLNNAERVRLGANDNETFTAYVHARNLISFAQTYALVAAGCFGGVANTLEKSKNAYDKDDSGSASKWSSILSTIKGAIRSLLQSTGLSATTATALGVAVLLGGIFLCTCLCMLKRCMIKRCCDNTTSPLV